MTVNALYPTVAPSLDLNFVRSGVLDSRVTFTRASTATYFNSLGALTTALTNVPRLDYNPSTLAAQGLLIEEQRTNQCTYSADFTNAAWVASLATKTTGVADPFGGNTAATVTATGIAGSIQNAAATVSISTVYTVSCWMRRRTGTGAVGIRAVENANTTVAITSTWARYSVTVTATQTIGRVGVFVQTIGDEIDMCGFQLEAGAFQTSYIPTSTVAVTRSADVASVNTLTPWYNATEGTLYVEVSAAVGFNVTGNFGRFAGIQDAISSNNTEMFFDGTANQAPRYRVRSGGVNQAIGNSATAYTANTLLKAGLAYAVNDFSGVSRGVVDLTDTSGVVPVGVTFLSLGSEGGGSNFINGYLRRITYFPVRLSNANLQAITT